MAWTVNNPVTIGNATRKSDYDKLWDNCDFFKIDHATDGQHILAGFQGSQYAADAEASDTYVVTLNPVPAAYFNGMVVAFKANTVNTGACTLNVNALGAKSILKQYNVALGNGDIAAGQMVVVIYDGTNFQLVNVPSATSLDEAVAMSSKLPKTDGIKGDGTAGRVLRCVFIRVEDSGTANAIDVSSGQRWNGDAVAVKTGLTKSGTVEPFSLNAAGNIITFSGASISGDPLVVLASPLFSNACGTALLCNTAVSGTDITITYTDAITGAAFDLTTITGDIYMNMIYITTA